MLNKWKLSFKSSIFGTLPPKPSKWNLQRKKKKSQKDTYLTKKYFGFNFLINYLVRRIRLNTFFSHCFTWLTYVGDIEAGHVGQTIETDDPALLTKGMTFQLPPLNWFPFSNYWLGAKCRTKMFWTLSNSNFDELRTGLKYIYPILTFKV